VSGAGSGQTSSGSLNSQLLSLPVTGDPAEIRLLLEKGADVNARNDYGDTMLLMATQFGHTDVVELLLEKGADLNARDHTGTPLINVAAQYSEPDVFKEGCRCQRQTRRWLDTLFFALMGYKGEEASLRIERLRCCWRMEPTFRSATTEAKLH
jgi:hypothetical protein